MWNKIKQPLIALLLAAGALLAGQASAARLYLATGESRIITTTTAVDTVFVSMGELADYEIISDTSVVIYAKKEGLAEFTLFDKQGKAIVKETVIINNLIKGLDQQIRTEYPDSQVVIQKIAKTYLLSGTVSSDLARDRIYQIVGEGTSEKKTKIDMEYSDSDSGKERITFLDKVFYEQVVNKITVPMTNQVNVKLTIAEVTKEFTDNVGLQWGTASTGSITQQSGQFILQKFKFDASTLGTLIAALSNDTVARVLAEPNLSVLSGETASFLVGGEFPIATSSSNGVNIVYKEFGIKLLVGAKVNEDKRIRVWMAEEVSSIEEQFIKQGILNNFPVLTTRRAKTTVELADGESFIVGGLISRQEKESLSKIPFIGNIPVLGALFRNTQTEREGRELVVVATVTLVKPVAGRDIVLPNFVRTSTAERFFNFSHLERAESKKQALDFVSQGGFIK